MLTRPYSFDAIMAPLGAERFFAEYEGKQPLHLKGGADKFRNVMNWTQLGDLLGQATIWSHNSLQLVLDKEQIQANAYCTAAPGRDGGQVLRPDPEKVKTYLRRGATLIANDIDHLAPDLIDFSRAMEEALQGKVQGNLYLSSRRRQGFAAHFDTHDVFAVHLEGTKTWFVYQGRVQDPIAHPRFKSLSREHHEKAKGELLMEVHMEPGDLLYLPRGQYHDALADEGGAVHIAFGITYPIGLDVLSMLFERMVAEPAFRANLPRARGPEAGMAMEQRLRELGRLARNGFTDQKLRPQIEAFQKSYHYPRHTYDLPDLLAAPLDQHYRVKAQGIRMVQQGGRVGLVREGSRSAAEVPPELTPMVDWVLKRSRFSRAEFAEAFPERQPAQLDRLLHDLGAMRLTEPA